MSDPMDKPLLYYKTVRIGVAEGPLMDPPGVYIVVEMKDGQQFTFGVQGAEEVRQIGALMVTLAERLQLVAAAGNA